MKENIELLGFHPSDGSGIYKYRNVKYHISYPYKENFIEKLDTSFSIDNYNYVKDSIIFKELSSLINYLKVMFINDKISNTKLKQTNKLISDIFLENALLNVKSKHPVLQNLSKNKISNLTKVFNDDSSYLDTYVQFIPFKNRNKSHYINNLFFHLFKATNNIKMKFSVLNSLFFDSIFKKEAEKMYRKLENVVIKNDIGYSMIMECKTEKYYKKSKLPFYSILKEQKSFITFLESPKYEHIKKIKALNKTSIFLEGNPNPSNDNVIIIDDSIMITENYDYNIQGKLEPISFTICADKSYIEIFIQRLKVKQNSANSFKEEVLKNWITE
jgi:hypothetical protein